MTAEALDIARKRLAEIDPMSAQSPGAKLFRRRIIERIAALEAAGHATINQEEPRDA